MAWCHQVSYILSGKARKKNGVWDLLYITAGRVGVDERWSGSEFQIVGAIDENDLRLPWKFCVKEHSEHISTRVKKIGVIAQVHTVEWEINILFIHNIQSSLTIDVYTIMRHWLDWSSWVKKLSKWANTHMEICFKPGLTLLMHAVCICAMCTRLSCCQKFIFQSYIFTDHSR